MCDAALMRNRHQAVGEFMGPETDGQIKIPDWLRHISSADFTRNCATVFALPIMLQHVYGYTCISHSSSVDVVTVRKGRDGTRFALASPEEPF
jgi:hypothetical protein